MTTYKLPEGLTPLERRVLLEYLEIEPQELTHDIHDALVFQLDRAEAEDIERTGCGFFRGFKLPPGVAVTHPIADGSYVVGYAVHPELVGGAIFDLFVREGVVSFLEACTMSGDWPQDEDAFSLQ
jgi:hypothetical protein